MGGRPRSLLLTDRFPSEAEFREVLAEVVGVVAGLLLLSGHGEEFSSGVGKVLRFFASTKDGSELRVWSR